MFLEMKSIQQELNIFCVQIFLPSSTARASKKCLVFSEHNDMGLLPDT